MGINLGAFISPFVTGYLAQSDSFKGVIVKMGLNPAHAWHWGFAAAGVGMEQIVKTTVFLADMNDFTAMNEVYGKYFAENPPARATVQAARLPRDAKVEIEAIAVTG